MAKLVCSTCSITKQASKKRFSALSEEERGAYLCRGCKRSAGGSNTATPTVTATAVITPATATASPAEVAPVEAKSPALVGVNNEEVDPAELVESDDDW